MKKLLLSLMLFLPMMAVAQNANIKLLEQEANAKRLGSFKDGASFYVSKDKSAKPLLAPNGMPVSPNDGYQRAQYNEKSHYLATVRINEDTMWLSYKDEKIDQVFKIERYVYNASSKDLFLEGEQVYLKNNIPYCSEIISNGRLRRAVWYNAHGQKERIYMFLSDKDITELQFYPSGKMSVRKDHFGTPEATLTAYDEEGHVAEWIDAKMDDKQEDFDTYFNKNFRINYLFVREVFKLYITVDSIGNYYASVFDSNGAFLTRMDCKGAPLGVPATINGHPVQSTFFCSVQYNPMEYVSLGDTLPIQCMRSQLATYHGINWLRSDIYFFVPADTCSLQGTLTENGDTTILLCFDKQSGNKVARQCYVENEFGKKIKEGWFSYYVNNKKSYEELFVNDTVQKTIHYYENEVPKMTFVREKNRKGAAWDSLYFYYPNGALKMLFIPDEKDDMITYYDKQGNPTENVVLPTYPGNVKALNKYLRKNVKMVDSKLWNIQRWNSLSCWLDVFVEVDENGKLLNVGNGAASCNQNYSGVPLTRMDINLLYDMLKDCILKDPTLWEPGSIQGEPTSLLTKVRVKYSYSRK